MGYTKGRVPLDIGDEIRKIPVDELGRHCGVSKWEIE